ncbi:hypothetical protein JAAARDRAFT_34310 [Jaapia argillacea MUCL 33604]|uniref:PH domain-containing protein n=1 Tax=Jaapia argillacea MUCL 33604 TaxID=933084 RepID=A0A067PUW4_9AGAM|nr:hypothetical protein JAAARDRAFT_34310 [Jaapia argillacea MUCL 33604]
MAHFSDGGGAAANLFSSTGDMRLQLQTLLDRKEKQLQQAGTLGQRVLAQQMELEERVRQLQDMEADKTDDDDIDADMRERYRELADTIRTWDSENVQLSSAFGGQRLVNGTHTPPSPLLEPLDLGRVDTERVANTSTGTSAAQSRRARNAAHRQDDVEFAFEIGSGLLTEVRRLQSLLGERDKAIQDMKEEKDDLEKTVESLRTALRTQEQSADKFKEENWNLEVTLQELRTQLTDTQATSQRLEGEHKRLTKQLNVSREQVDQHKNESERLKVQYDELKAKHETDVAHARKHAASLQRDKADLQSSIDSLKAEVAKAGRRLPRFGSPLTPNGDHNKSQMVTPDMRDDDDVFGTTGGASTRGRKFDNGALFPPDGFDPDSSPEPSPSKPFIAPNHPSNEIETLQRQLAHAQRQIGTLKGTLQREKETRMEYRRKLDASPGGMPLGPEEEEEMEEDMDDVEEMGVLPKPKTKVTPFRATRGRGRGRGRGGLTLAQRLGMAANSPASEYNDDEDLAEVTVTPPPPLPALSTSLQDIMFDEAEEDQDEEVQQRSIGEQSPTPSNRVSVDGMDPAFANVLKRTSSTSSIPPQFSPLRQSVVARGARGGGTVGRRNRGGAAFQEVRPPSLVGQPEALADEMGLGSFAAESDVTYRQSVTTVEFGVQTDVVEEPVVVLTPPPVAPEPVVELVPPPPPPPPAPIMAEVAIQVDPEPVPEPEPVVVAPPPPPPIETHEMNIQTDEEPVVLRVEMGMQHDAFVPPPVAQASAQVQTDIALTLDVDTQTPPPSSPTRSDAHMQTDVPPTLLGESRRATVTQADFSKFSLVGDSTITGRPSSGIMLEEDEDDIDDGATETGAEDDYHDARQSIALTTPTNDSDFHSMYTVTDQDFSDDDDESIKASRISSRLGAATPSSFQDSSVPPTPIVEYDEKSVSVEPPPPEPEAPKPELKEISIQTDEWSPPPPPTPPVIPAPVPIPIAVPPSPFKAVANSPQQFHFISPPSSAGPASPSIPIVPASAIRDLNITRPRTSQSDRRRSIESALSSMMDDSTPRSRVPSAVASPAVDKTRPPMMALPPPPRAPPPPGSMAPPPFIPERRMLTTSTGSQEIPPPRPTSPPPPELIQRATTPTFGSALAVPGRGLGPRQHGSSLPPSAQQALGPRPSTNSFRSAANAATHAHHGMASPAALVAFGRRELSSTSLNSERSGGSQRSSMSSDHFMERSQHGHGAPPTTPGRAADTSMQTNGGGSTDPAVIHSITQTMIGEFLYKYQRRAIGKGYGERRHRRFFWVHPYTKTLYWSSADPGSSNVAESSAKSAYIEGVRSILDPNPMPPGLYQYSVVVSTPNREMKFTAPTKERHDIWLNALKYLLSRPNAMAVASPGNATVGPSAPLSPMSVEADLPEGENGNPLMASPQSFRSARSGHTEASADSWNHTPRGRRSQSQLSARGSVGKRAGTPAAEYLRWAGSSEEPLSPTKSFEHIPGQDDEGLDFELHDETMSDGGFEGLENVRACCEGRHTVGRAGGRGHHHHHHHHHSHPPTNHHLDVNPSDLARPISPSAWSFRSRESSRSRDGKGFFSWGREEGKRRFGSRRSTKTVPTTSTATHNQ